MSPARSDHAPPASGKGPNADKPAVPTLRFRSELAGRRKNQCLRGKPPCWNEIPLWTRPAVCTHARCPALKRGCAESCWPIFPNSGIWAGRKGVTQPNLQVPEDIFPTGTFFSCPSGWCFNFPHNRVLLAFSSVLGYLKDLGNESESPELRGVNITTSLYSSDSIFWKHIDYLNQSRTCSKILIRAVLLVEN